MSIISLLEEAKSIKNSSGIRARSFTQKPLIDTIVSQINVPHTSDYLAFEVFTAVVMKSIIFWDMTPCSLHQIIFLTK
jgi:hypothetical protein